MGWDRTWVAGLAKWESVVGVVYGRNALDGKGNCGTFKEDEVDEKEENRDYEQEMEVSLQSLRRLSRKDKYVGISRWGASSSFRRVERDETLAVE
ncbi:hypothetical protein PV326_006839 [Microctonus aethiopoides]|nr:hypothetical protein PV326_006839 [Microctonus aethiopoides]